MPQAQINGHLCNYLTRGDPAGIPLVFLHGFPFSMTMWTRQLEALHANFYAVTYDLRGMGNSEAPPSDYSMDVYTQDLAGLLDLLQIKRPIVCGLSMGGYIILHAVALDSDLFRGIVLCNTRSGADSPQVRAGRQGTIRQVRETGMEGLVNAQLPKLMTPEHRASDADWVKELRSVMLSTPRAGTAGALAAMRDRVDTTSALVHVDVPVQLIFGEHDIITPPAEGRIMAAQLPSSQLAVIEHAGHVSNLENREQFNAALIAYLEQFSSEPPPPA